MRRALASWLGLFVVYALALAANGPDVAAPVPWAVDQAREALGTVPVQLLGATATALAFALLGATATRTVGPSWATAATVLVGLSPPALACATRVGADPWAALCLAGGVALAARCRTEPRRREAVAAVVLLAIAPWFGVWHGVAAVLVVGALVRWSLRRGRPVLALLCGEVLLASAVSLVEVGLPAGPDPAPGAGALPLVAVLLDRGAGVVRWAPVLLLAPFGAFWVWRSLRDGLARIVPERADAEAAGGLAAGVCLATVGASAFAGLSPLPALPTAVLLVAWGLRRAPRAGVLLGVLTLVGSVWAAVALAAGDAAGWTGPGLDAPWGPLTGAFPRVAAGGWWPVAVGVALAVAVLALLAWERRARAATHAAVAGRR